MIEEEKAQRGKNYHNFNSFQANDPPEGLTNKRIIYELVVNFTFFFNFLFFLTFFFFEISSF